MEAGSWTPAGRLRPLLAMTVIVSRPTGEAELDLDEEEAALIVPWDAGRGAGAAWGELMVAFGSALLDSVTRKE